MTKLTHRRNLTVGAAAAIALLFFFREDIEAIALPTSMANVDDAIVLSNRDLPRPLADGTTLRGVSKVDDRIVYDHQGVRGVAPREAYARILSERCAEWRRHLRSGTVRVVETTYSGEGSASTFYLHRGQCG